MGKKAQKYKTMIRGYQKFNFFQNYTKTVIIFKIQFGVIRIIKNNAKLNNEYINQFYLLTNCYYVFGIDKTE